MRRRPRRRHFAVCMNAADHVGGTLAICMIISDCVGSTLAVCTISTDHVGDIQIGKKTISNRVEVLHSFQEKGSNIRKIFHPFGWKGSNVRKVFHSFGWKGSNVRKVFHPFGWKGSNGDSNIHEGRKMANDVKNSCDRKKFSYFFCLLRILCLPLKGETGKVAFEQPAGWWATEESAFPLKWATVQNHLNRSARLPANPAPLHSSTQQHESILFRSCCHRFAGQAWQQPGTPRGGVSQQTRLALSQRASGPQESGPAVESYLQDHPAAFLRE